MTPVAPAARREFREAYERLRRYFIVALQAGLAAGLAWYVAGTLLENPQPLFAPAAAVGTIAAAIGNRIRRTAELLGGVIVGVLVGDLIIKLIGAGPVQTGLVVALAISLAVVIRGSGAVMVQAGSTAVLLGTVEPSAPDLAVPRTANALVGGGVAVVVALLLLPVNPVRVVHRAAGPTLDLFAKELTATANALAAGDARTAGAALERLSDIARSRARAAGLGFSGTIVASQLFIVVGELLQASGMTKIEADRMAGVCEHRAESRPDPNAR